MKRFSSVFSLLLLITLSGLGCTSAQQTAIPTQTDIDKSTPVPTSTHRLDSVKNTPTPSPTFTKTSTATRTPTPISTPFSTISPQQRDQYVHQLNTLNEICELPCWGMILPGQTKFEDIEPYMQSLTSDYGWQSYSINDVIGKGEIYVHFSVENHYIIEMYFPSVPYELNEFLLQNGIPEEIWIRENYAPTLDPYWYFELALYYPSRGFMGFSTGETEGGLDAVNICPGKNQVKQQTEPDLELFIWGSEYVQPFPELDNDENWHHTETEFYYSVSEVSDMDTKEFYSTYSDPTRQDECFNIDLSKFMTFVTSTPVP